MHLQSSRPLTCRLSYAGISSKTHSYRELEDDAGPRASPNAGLSNLLFSLRKYVENFGQETGLHIMNYEGMSQDLISSAHGACKVYKQTLPERLLGQQT